MHVFSLIVTVTSLSITAVITVKLSQWSNKSRQSTAKLIQAHRTHPSDVSDSVVAVKALPRPIMKAECFD